MNAKFQQDKYDEAYCLGFEKGFRLIAHGEQYELPKNRNKISRVFLQGVLDGIKMATESENKKAGNASKPEKRN